MTPRTDFPFDADALAVETLPDERRQALLTAYLDDELSPAAARHVTTWLDANPEHLREVEHLRRTWDLLEIYEDEAVPATFASEVLKRVGVGAPRRAWGRAALLAAAAALLFLLGSALFRSHPPTSPTHVQAAAGVLDEVPADLLADVDLLLSLTDEEFHGVLLDDPEAP